MGAMNHERDVYGICWYCGEVWPCSVVEIRRELAEYIRGHGIRRTGDASYDDGRESGQQSAADLIDY